MTIQIWDLPLRIFHWLLTASILAAYITSEMNSSWQIWHGRVGTLVLALMMFRLAWGFMGSTYARFNQFIPVISHLPAYLSCNWFGVGHNPLGSLAIVTMLATILAQACSGLFTLNEDINLHGPLYELASGLWVERLSIWHRQLDNILLILIILHLLAIAYYTFFRQKNLLIPMITGNIRVADKSTLQPVRGGGTKFWLIAMTMAFIVFWLIESGALLSWLSARLANSPSTISSPQW